jgi:biopolymer transport protein TolQ
LFVAVPALIAYNLFTQRIRVFAAAIDDFCRELLNSLEEIPIRASVQIPRPVSLAGSAGLEPPREVDSGLYK